MDLLDFAEGLEISYDKNGCQTHIMYHGTTLKNALKIRSDGFIPSYRGMLGRGIYVSRSFQKASAYPKPNNLQMGDEPVVLKLRVWVGNVIQINYKGHPLQKSWHQFGFDTAWVPPNCGMVPSGLEEDCVWDPNQIEVLEILNKNGSRKNLCDHCGGPSGPCPTVPYGAPDTFQYRAPLSISSSGLLPRRVSYYTHTVTFSIGTAYTLNHAQINVGINLGI